MSLPETMDAGGNITASASRRNGKAASCEPCRKRKIRCDHQRPICGRCRQRGLEKRCFYHPAPLTKPREPLLISPGPMEMSMSAEVNEGQGSPNIYRNPSLDATPTSHTSARSKSILDYGANGNEDIQTIRLRKIQGFLGHLRWIAQIHKSLSDYYSGSASALVPGALILPAVSDLLERWNRSSDTNALCRSLANRILQSTEAEIDVTQITSAADFCSLHHGQNLRLEILGIIFALAGRATMFYAGKGRSPFVMEMFCSSNELLSLARDMIPEATDALVWLQYENHLLTNSLSDDRGTSSWRRLTEATNELYALGANRESSYASVPFFLAEMRRRTFVVVYHSDKLLAVMDDRPPWITTRHADCRMPLDITDEELLAFDPANTFQFPASLRSDGWSIEERYSSATWARLRYQVAVMREEVLEYNFQSPTAENVQRLKNLSMRNRALLDALPLHLRYSPERWDSGLSDPLCYMLTVTYLSHCQLDFQIFRLIEKSDPGALSLLLQVSEEIVATVLHVGNLRTRASFLAHDFKFLILAYGIPSAAILAAALESAATNPGYRLPNDMSRSHLIRSLSVFVPMLESLDQLPSFRKQRSMESARLISKAIDRALEGPGNSEPPSAQNQQTFASSEFSAGSGPSDPNLILSNFDPALMTDDGMHLMDFANWSNNIDWSNIGNEWMTF